jgi:TRAP-type C4-dicarboxylate transport system permease small subunit
MIKKGLREIDDIIATFALAAVILLTGINVLLRYVFSSPIAWTTEIALGLFIWFVFIGISSAMKRDGHIGVDFFVKKLPKKLQVISGFLRAAAIYFVLIYVFIYLGLQLTLMSVGKLTPILGISYQFINAAVPIGGILTAIHFTAKYIASYREGFGREGRKS